MKISVLTPSLNSDKYLHRAINSVLVQDYDNWEHIVVDGSSTDNTLDILEKYSHLKWISEPDQGQSDAMNKAFDMVEGDIIVYLNADDYFEKGAFRSVIDAFQENDEIKIVVGNVVVIYCDRDGKIINQRRDIPRIHYPGILYPYKFRFPVNPVAYFYKKSVQTEIGPFPIDNHFSMDYWFILRAFRNSNLKKIDHVLGYYWVDGKNKTSVNHNPRERYIVAIKYCWENDFHYLPIFVLKHFFEKDLKEYIQFMMLKIKRMINNKIAINVF